VTWTILSYKVVVEIVDVPNSFPARTTGGRMIVSFCTSHIHCWSCAGSVDLLSETENAPTNNVQPTSKLTDVIELSCGIKRPDLPNHMAE
jgi:hypothetical protein